VGIERRVGTNRAVARRRASRSSRRLPSTIHSRSIRSPIRRRSTDSASSTPTLDKSGGCSTRPSRRKIRSNKRETLEHCSTSGQTSELARRFRRGRGTCGHRRRPGHGLLTRGSRTPRGWGDLVLARRTKSRSRRPAQTERLASRTRAAVRWYRRRPRFRSFAAMLHRGLYRHWRRLVAVFQLAWWRRRASWRRIQPRSITRGRPRLGRGAEKMMFVRRA